jgi:hypothetical protein
VEVPPLQYLAIDGEGDPEGSEQFAASVAALYTATQTPGPQEPAPSGADGGPFPLEGLWWSTDPKLDLESGDPARWQDRTSWRWTLLLRQPEPVDPARLEAARTELAAKADTPQAEAAASAVRAHTLREGLCIQVLHEGPIENEPATIGALHLHLKDQGLIPAGKHHEIYLIPSYAAPPQGLRTILRQPVSQLVQPGAGRSR